MLWLQEQETWSFKYLHGIIFQSHEFKKFRILDNPSFHKFQEISWRDYPNDTIPGNSLALHAAMAVILGSTKLRNAMTSICISMGSSPQRSNSTTHPQFPEVSHQHISFNKSKQLKTKIVNNVNLIFLKFNDVKYYDLSGQTKAPNGHCWLTWQLQSPLLEH